MNLVKLATLNVNGLRSTANRNKRRQFFSWFKKRKLDIVFIQETHYDDSIENIWLNEWGGRGYFSHGDNRSRGVAILISPKVNISIQTVVKSTSGRFLIL